MIREVVFRSIARLEFDEAALWYEGKQAGLGHEFLEAVDETLQSHRCACRIPRETRPETSGKSRLSGGL
jgi:hypothetical protein|tara:strand:+ start:128 stop:334 length:207 start_codon:yes stop_codon:yes gene_type:complete